MAEVGRIDFKSVGERPNSNITEEEVQNKVPIGIRTPMRMGQSNDGLFAMNKSIGDEIKQNLRNLLQTNWGERPGRYQFGANLQELNFEFSSEGFDDEAAVRVKNATNRWMPYILLKNMERFVESVEGEPTAKIRLRIMYDVPAAKLKNQIIDVIFYIAG